MKTNKIQRFIMIFLALLLISGQTANAAIFDWISGSSDVATPTIPENNWSFDKLYAEIQKFNLVSAIPTVQQNSILENGMPVTPKTKIKSSPKTFVVTATGYSSTIDQTDSTPFITAAGTHVRDGIIAANFLPFGTVVRIPDLFGDKTFIIEDRMNKRYWYNIDIWFPERNQAKLFGVKKVTIEII